MSQIPGDRQSWMAGSRSEAEEVFEAALARYFAERHDRVGAFVDRHFSFRGSLALHRHALGWDMLRVPVNLFLTGPTVVFRKRPRPSSPAGWARVRWPAGSTPATSS